MMGGIRCGFAGVAGGGCVRRVGWARSAVKVSGGVCVLLGWLERDAEVVVVSVR